MPAGVRLYRQQDDFLAEDPSRKAHNGSDVDLLGGWDVAEGFRLAEPTVPESSLESEWRISVVNRDIYAVLRPCPATACALSKVRCG
jgi:hypothetical protein